MNAAAGPAVRRCGRQGARLAARCSAEALRLVRLDLLAAWNRGRRAVPLHQATPHPTSSTPDRLNTLLH